MQQKIKVKGKPLQHKQVHLRPLSYKLISMRKEPRKGTGRRRHLQRHPQNNKEKKDKG